MPTTCILHAAAAPCTSSTRVTLPVIVIMKKNTVIVLLLFCLLSCDSKEGANQLKRIVFVSAVSKEYEQRIDLKEGEYLTFKFSNLYYIDNTDSSDYRRSLFITIPANDSAFTYKKDSTHLSQHLVADCRGVCGDIRIEEIDSAEISGKLIGNDKWLIEAKTKYFDFTRVIHLEFNTLEKETIWLMSKE